MSKNPDAMRTISEVAEELELPQHVLRFWETRFSQIKPMKHRGGRRYYRTEDVDLIRGIKSLLYDEGYTIRGVQRLLKDQGNKFAVNAGHGAVPAGVLVEGDDTPDVHVDVPVVAQLSVENAPRGKGLLGRLTGAGGDAEAGEFDGDAIKQLQSALQDLLECKRLLDQTRES